jgi:hypothetical protein
MAFINYWNLIKFIRSISEKIANLLLELIWRSNILRARKFVFTGRLPMKVKILIIEYEQNPSNRSGASEERTHK